MIMNPFYGPDPTATRLPGPDPTATRLPGPDPTATHLLGNTTHILRHKHLFSLIWIWMLMLF